MIPLLPFLAGILIPIFWRRIGEEVYKIGFVAHCIVFFFAVLALIDVSINIPIRLNLLPPMTGGMMRFGLYIDRLTAVMMVLVTAIGSIIHLFARRYLQQDPGYKRFYSLLSLITCVLLLLVSSPNLLMLFIFWQLISWVLYLLLAHNNTHLISCRAAFKTFIVLRFGDLLFLAGVLLAYGVYDTLDFSLLFERAAADTAPLSLLPGEILSIHPVTAITLLIFVGAMSKSAQFPLHIWLPDTMYAPAPVSALMHAGIVNSGGFLLNRLAPLYGLSSTSLNIVFVIGALTTFLGAGMMLCQNDVKKMLGYSTIAQMGYMIMECGLGAFALAIFHFIAHGLFKASLFLSSGSVIHTTRLDPKTPKKTKISQILSDPKPAVPFSKLIWLTGSVITLILPLVILFAAHDVFHIPLSDKAHGAVIFLFFGWVTSSQAIISLYRMNAVASWKVVAAMIASLVLVVFTYLFAGELFTLFLYPGPGEAARYFEAAALHSRFFDLFVILTSIVIISVWAFLYADAKGQHILMPPWVEKMKNRIYVLFINRLYLDLLYQGLSSRFIRLAHILDKRVLAWWP